MERWMSRPVRRAIHISSKMDILEHEKEKTFVKVENLWKIASLLSTSRISNQTKLWQLMGRFFGETLCEASRHIKRLTRSTPYYEGSISEIRGVGERLGGSEISCRGGKKIALLYCRALWYFRGMDVPDFST
ncbi:hypothetical protein AVEN_265271-1 [Araneus ventricosus]|uniref:Uncharacterized protein n=1 Tax=Araneus ventricosus TaxID=182803 RepID=A0A4Y2JZK3_ARAVE|nr:hypothetical protein AVEN_265271-1 [Araneus ventricosus]